MTVSAGGGSSFGGATLGGLASLLTSLFGTGTTTTNQSGNTSTNANSSTNSDQNTTGTSSSTSTQNTISNQNTTGTTVTTGTAPANVVNAEENIANTAANNATNPNIINNLVNSTLNTAATTYGTSGAAGTARGVGLYDSPTQSLIEGYAQGQAVTQAVQAVTSYQTAQEQIASNATAAVLDALKGSTSTTSQSTTGNQTVTADQLLQTIQNIIASSSSKASSTSQNQTTGTSSNGGILGSVICTELTYQQKMDNRLYQIVTYHFNKKVPLVGRKSYYLWAKYAVKHLQDHPNSRISKVIASITVARAKMVAREVKYKKHYPWKLSGYAARWIFRIVTTGAYLFIYLPNKLKGLRHVDSSELSV